MKTTPERLDELERLYWEQADCLDASSYDIEDLIHDAREAHRLIKDAHGILDALADTYIRTEQDEYRYAYLKLESMLTPLLASPHDGKGMEES